MAWSIFYFSGDGYVSDGTVAAGDEQEALWKASALHPGAPVYVQRKS